MPTRSNSRRLAGRPTRVMIFGDAELAAEQRRQQVALVVVDDRHQDVAVPDVLRSRGTRGRCRRRCSTSVRPSRAGSISPRSASRSRMRQVDDRRLLEPLGQLQADVAAADDRHLQLAAGAARVDQRLAPPASRRACPSRSPCRRLQLGGAARHEHAGAALDGDDQRVRAAGAGRRAWSRSAANRARAGTRAAAPRRRRTPRRRWRRARDDALDVGGQLRLRPDDAVDAEARRGRRPPAVPRKSARDTKQIVCGVAEPAGQRAGRRC